MSSRAWKAPGFLYLMALHTSVTKLERGTVATEGMSWRVLG